MKERSRGFWRIEVVIRNVAKELPWEAVGTLTIDFLDDDKRKEAEQALADGLRGDLAQSVVLTCESGESLGFNPHHYSYHTVVHKKSGHPEPPSTKWVVPQKTTRKSRGS
jgi:hypothetical protein